MENIKRYDDDGYYGRYELAHGPYVMYDDHLAIVEKLKAEIAQLEIDAAEGEIIVDEESYRNGYNDGYADAREDFKED